MWKFPLSSTVRYNITKLLLIYECQFKKLVQNLIFSRLCHGYNIKVKPWEMNIPLSVWRPNTGLDVTFDTKWREKNSRFLGGFSLYLHQFWWKKYERRLRKASAFLITGTNSVSVCTNFAGLCLIELVHRKHKLTAFLKLRQINISHTAFHNCTNFTKSGISWGLWVVKDQ